jgi:hypothetical protein
VTEHGSFQKFISTTPLHLYLSFHKKMESSTT